MTIRHDLYSNCAQDVFLNLLNYYKFEQEYLLSAGWSFSYSPRYEDKNFLSAVNIYNGEFNELEIALSELYGIELDWINISDLKSFEDCTNYIRYIISKNDPVCIYIDSFFCNWQEGYQNYHNLHLVIMLGLCETGFICADPYLNLSDIYLDFQDFWGNVDKLIVLRKRSFNKVSCGKSILISIAKRQLVENSENKNAFSQIRTFADDILTHKNNIVNELSDDNIAFIPIIKKFFHISYGRMSFSRFLSFIASNESNNYFATLSLQFAELSKTWSIIANKLIKYKVSYFNPEYINTIHKLLINIAEQEETIAKQLLQENF